MKFFRGSWRKPTEEVGNDQQTLTILRRIAALETNIMAQFDDIETLIAAIDLSTNKIGDKLTGLAAQVAALQAQIAAGSPVSSTQLDLIKGQLQAEADKLAALGADPETPIPDVPIP